MWMVFALLNVILSREPQTRIFHTVGANERLLNKCHQILAIFPILKWGSSDIIEMHYTYL